MRPVVLSTVAASLLLSSCIVSSEEAGCLAKLGILPPDALVYEGGTFTLAAFWDGDARDCPNDFTWSVSGPAQLLQTSGESVQAAATGRGDAEFTVTAGSYTATYLLELLRTTSDIDVGYLGLPAGLDGRVRLTGPGGFDETVTTPRVLMDVEAGNYSYEAFEVSGGAIGHRYGGGAGTFQVGINDRYELRATYERRTAQLDYEALGIPAGTPASLYGRLSMNGAEIDITQSPQSLALESGTYEWMAKTVDWTGFRYRPEVKTGTLDVVAPNLLQLVVLYAATRGRIDLVFDGLPSGALVPVMLSGPKTIEGVGPGSIYAKPGNYFLGLAPFTYANPLTNRMETFVPNASTVPIEVIIGQIVQTPIFWQLTFAIGTYLTSIGVSDDPFGHAAFIAMLATLNLIIQIDYPPATAPAGAAAVQGTITISGPFPWVTVSGPLEDDGSFVATGTGTVAGFPNVPVTFTGTLSEDGATVSGILQMGQDTAPTGLPNGAIRYTVEGMRVAVTP